MQIRLAALFATILSFSCSEKPGYHDYVDIRDHWLNTDTISFDVPVKDTVNENSIWIEIRCSSDYEWSRFFSGYEIRDSVGHQLDSGLINAVLFDPVTGVPTGKGGIGDLYENKILFKNNYRFPYPGTYSFLFWQMMRRDSIEGIRNVGLSLKPIQ